MPRKRSPGSRAHSLEAAQRSFSSPWDAVKTLETFPVRCPVALESELQPQSLSSGYMMALNRGDARRRGSASAGGRRDQAVLLDRGRCQRPDQIDRDDVSMHRVRLPRILHRSGSVLDNESLHGRRRHSADFARQQADDRGTTSRDAGNLTCGEVQDEDLVARLEVNLVTGKHGGAPHRPGHKGRLQRPPRPRFPADTHSLKWRTSGKPLVGALECP